MNLPSLRDQIATYLRERLPSVEISTEYSPVPEFGDGVFINIYPVGYSVDYADRAQRKCEPRISITVIQKMSDKKDEVVDSILSHVDTIVQSLHGVHFGGCIAKDLTISDPIISEGIANQQNVAASEIIVGMYAHETRV